MIIVGTADGRFAIVAPGYESEESDGRQVVTIHPSAEKVTPIGLPGVPILDIAYGDSGSSKLVVALQANGNNRQVSAAIFQRKRSLMATVSSKRYCERLAAGLS
jgi:hypothetical protein